MKEEWRLLIFWVLAVLLVLVLSGCTSAPNGAINVRHTSVPTHSIVEPFGTVHKYIVEPSTVENELSELYCLTHGVLEVVTRLRTDEWKVRRWRKG